MNKLLKDTLLIGKTELLIQLRNPLWLFFGLFQPVVYLALFSPFLGGIASSPGFPSGNAIQFFAPGLLIMNTMFGAGFAGFGLIDQLRTGYIERIRVTPVNRLSIALGLVFRTPVVLLVQSFLLILTAMLFGLKFSFVGILILAVLLILVGITMAAVSYSIALITKEEGALAAITNFFTLPLLLLSGVLLPIEFAPSLLRNLAKFDPFSYAVDAARNLINGSLHDHSILTAFIVFIVLGALASAWFIRSMREAVA